MFPPKGVFVVVGVVVTDKECGGNEGGWRRQGFFPDWQVCGC